MVKTKYQEWLALTKSDAALHGELAAIKSDAAEIEDRFYRDLGFGTGGLRGKIGAGCNRMNVFTVCRASMGLADYLVQRHRRPSAVIAFDSRIMSLEFAQAAAAVLAGRGVKTYIFKELAPTPVLSFAVRRLKAAAGIVITASHNPGEYNGYKVYDGTGCQITTAMAAEISHFISRQSYCDLSANFSAHLADGLISYVDAEVSHAFTDAVLSHCREDLSGLNVTYTPLNGAGLVYVREVLSRGGVTCLNVVPEQEMPDGNFVTCPYPNPEEQSALKLAAALAEKKGSDIVLATDPDCDRVGAAVRQGGGTVYLTGNEIGILMTDYLLKRRAADGTLAKNPLIITTIVSGTLPEKIIKSYGGTAKHVFTGFKFIGEAMNRLEKNGESARFMLGMEESCGYLIGDFARDKDAVGACLLICEMAKFYKRQDLTLIDALEAVYQKHGYCSSALSSYVYEGQAGAQKIADIMGRLRESGLREIAGQPITKVTDYTQSDICGEHADVIVFESESCKLIARPSGTEPKLKIYLHAIGKNAARCAQLADKLKTQADGLV